jgi:hypothetical protein
MAGLVQARPGIHVVMYDRGPRCGWRRITDISSQKSDCLSGSKFCPSGSLPSMNAHTGPHRKIRELPDALEAMRRDAWNAVPRRPKCGRKGRPEAKNLESIKGRLEAL